MQIIEKAKYICDIFKKNNPNPESDLIYVNNYTFLVAVLLSAQSTDNMVNKATKDLFKIYNTPRKILDLGEEGLKKYIKIIGLYNNKAKNIIALSKILIKKHNGQIPDNREELTKLPGVGNKTANVILASIFNKAVIAVDTHVMRVSNRLGFTKEKNPDKVEKDLVKIIPEHMLSKANNWMVLHGRYICKARKPDCNICPINSVCNFINIRK